jgi:hypothetical protein
LAGLEVKTLSNGKVKSIGNKVFGTTSYKFSGSLTQFLKDYKKNFTAQEGSDLNAFLAYFRKCNNRILFYSKNANSDEFLRGRVVLIKAILLRTAQNIKKEVRVVEVD